LRTDRARLEWAAALSGLALMVELASSSRRGRDLDRRLFRALNAGRGGAADRFFGGVTELGSIAASTGAAAVLVATRRPRPAARALGAAATMWVLGQALKESYLRVRPFDALPDIVRLLIGKPAGTSWPSSHPAVLLAFLTVAGEELGLSPSRRAALTGIAGAVAASRVYLGVHYPSDVVAGLMLGRAVGMIWLSMKGRQVQ
jgi:membrane-associated phospholipid phosphatase